LSLSQEFNSAIGESAISVVDFFATWCGPCKAVAPKVAALAAEKTEVRFYKVDVDELDTLAEEQDIQAMPTFKFYRDGACVGTVQGANIEAIKKQLASL
jgi:thioredoxin 1